jgi:hypothetical protein
LHRRLGLPQVPVKHFANGAERNGLIVALDQSAEPRDRARRKILQLAQHARLAPIQSGRIKASSSKTAARVSCYWRINSLVCNILRINHVLRFEPARKKIKPARFS